jgi:hypothetical protein
VKPDDWDWSRTVVDHLDVHASDFRESYRDYAAGYYAAYLLDPDGNNIEALYRDAGNPGHAG